MTSFEAHLKSGEEYLKAARPDLALPELLQALEQSAPGERRMRISNTIARVQDLMGHRKEAIQSFESTLAEPETGERSVREQKAVALNNLAWIYFKTGDEQAEATAAKAYAAAPENGAIVDTYGWILLANGKTDEAVAVLREAVANSEEPGNAEIRFHLASALVESGEVVEAKGVLEELLDSDVDFESKQDAESMLKNL